jgi:hypothetical protein
MGMKSRSNWNLSTCLREDCVNRGICDFCVKYDLYIPQKDIDAIGRQDTPQSHKNSPTIHFKKERV